MPTNLFILIFVASPVDYARNRHAALYVEFESYAQNAKAGSQTALDAPADLKSSLMEVVGASEVVFFLLFGLF